MNEKWEGSQPGFAPLHPLTLVPALLPGAVTKGGTI